MCLWSTRCFAICMCCRVIRSSKRTYPNFPLHKTHPSTLTVTPAPPPHPHRDMVTTETSSTPLSACQASWECGGGVRGSPWDQCILLSGSYVSRGKIPAPRRPQTRREEGMEEIPCIPRPPGLQTSWRMCGEAGQAELGPWDPIPKVLLLPSCLASVSVFTNL